MSYIDISRKLAVGTAVWPGDSPFNLTRVLDRLAGDSVNLTTLILSAHTASHVDAPFHFADDGPTIEALDLEPFWGVAQVVTAHKRSGPLYPEDFVDYDLSRVRRLLVRSAASDLNPQIFPKQFVYPSPELAEHLGSLGIILYGADTPSMDAWDSTTLEGHHALSRNGIAILEWLDLSKARDGIYELVALPLKIAGGDGSPVRAVLRTTD